VNEKFGCESVDEVSSGFKIKSVVQLSNGSTSAILTSQS
jgi:hypothetical protein